MKRYKRYTAGVLASIACITFIMIWQTEQKSVVAPGQTQSLSIATSNSPTTLIEQTLIVPVESWKRGIFKNPIRLLMPNNFRVNLFATGLRKPRMMDFGQDGTLYVTDPDAGTVYALPDHDKNGIADDKIAVATDLGYPTGIAWHNNDLFIADTTRVFRLSNYDSSPAMEEKEILIDTLPAHGKHITRTLAFGPDNNLYVSVGSSCNACEDDPRRAAILQFSPFGTDEKIFASGLRNAVGLALDPESHELYATDNGTDFLGDNLPPDEIDVVHEGKNYGWPYCYGNRVPDPQRGTQHTCATTEPPDTELQAHSAPLGLRFAPQDLTWPNNFSHNLFVAFHGSSDRSVPTGYKIVRIWRDSDGAHVADFLSGWLNGTTVLGRPVDVIFDKSGNMFVTDDKNGVIYRVSYHE